MKHPAIPAYLALLRQNLAKSEDEAKRLVLAGRVFLGENRVEKSSQKVNPLQTLTVRAKDKFVSRGGLKLEGLLAEANISVADKICMDIGASTGGFTDCLLQHGAQEVVAVDVGKGLLDDCLRRDPRVTSLENQNFRLIHFAQIGRRFDLVTVDVSFISLATLLEALIQFLKPGAILVALFKPQFEVKSKYAPKGVVKNQRVIDQALERVVELAKQKGFSLATQRLSQVKGPKGNQEIFLVFDYSVAPPGILG